MKKALEYLKDNLMNTHTFITKEGWEKGHIFGLKDVKKALKIAQQEKADEILDIIKDFEFRNPTGQQRYINATQLKRIIKKGEYRSKKHCGGNKR